MKKGLKIVKWLLAVMFIIVGLAQITVSPEADITADTVFETTEIVAEEKITSDSVENANSNVTTKNSEFISADYIPAYLGEQFYVVNNNIPFFESTELTTTAFEMYSDLDDLGRCGIAYANICKEIMPTEERGEIGNIKPSGWNQAKYPDIIESKYLYNRCHLIGFQLAGENANSTNLITGTRALNVADEGGMLPFENLVADYVKETNNHVLYRVTPIFTGDNLVADGVLMEAMSVEDNGAGVEFCVFVYNVQPGIIINYANGASHEGDPASAAISTSLKNKSDKIPSADNEQSSEESASSSSSETVTTTQTQTVTEVSSTVKYVLNTHTLKIHKPTCSSVSKISVKNYAEVLDSDTTTIDELISSGYSKCKNCNPN